MAVWAPDFHSGYCCSVGGGERCFRSRYGTVFVVSESVVIATGFGILQCQLWYKILVSFHWLQGQQLQQPQPHSDHEIWMIFRPLSQEKQHLCIVSKIRVTSPPLFCSSSHSNTFVSNSWLYFSVCNINIFLTKYRLIKRQVIYS